MSVEPMECESMSEDDEIEKMIALWREHLCFTDRELRQHAETLVSDISQFSFDFSSDATKFERYGREFLEIVKSRSANDAIKHVDLFWIHEQLYANKKETSIITADSEADAGNAENLITQEFLEARKLLENLHTLDGAVFYRVLSEPKYVNIRKFIDAGLKHEKMRANDFQNLVTFFDGLELDGLLPLHKCIEEGEIFLLDFLFTNVLRHLTDKSLKKILAQRDENNNNNNIFQLVCGSRIKFAVEEVWSLMQKAFEGDPAEIERILLNRNVEGKNAFQMAFQMPLAYKKSDFVNETKNRNALLNFYRDPGPIELELYNFDSCLNAIFDIGRRNVSDKNKKKLIVSQTVKATKLHETYEYSKKFSDFRCDFIQLRFYCITKISSIKTDNMESVSRVYNFMSHYVNYFIHWNCASESDLIALYQKLSFDGFLSDFFKIFVFNNFCESIARTQKYENFAKLIQIAKKVLSQKDYHQLIAQAGRKGHNALQLSIISGDIEKFRLVWSSFEFDRKRVVNWILTQNEDGKNSLYLAISERQIEMLQPMLNYFSENLTEADIVDIFERSTTTKYKFLSIPLLHYSQAICSLLIDFIQNHVSVENQRNLIDASIISLAVSKQQESATMTTLSLIESLFDEHEIKELLFGKNWEGQTAFHMASKNSNLSQLQSLCKFARYYLSEDDFVELVSAKDMNGYSIVNDTTTHDEIYNNLPNLTNFYTNYCVYLWLPLNDCDILKEAFRIGEDIENRENIYLARRLKDDGSDEFKIFGIKNASEMAQTDEYVDVLAGNGLEWTPKGNSDMKPIKLDNFFIIRQQNNVRLLLNLREEDAQFDVLCANDQNLSEINSSNHIFKRSF